MTEDKKKDEILSEESKDKDKVDIQDPGNAPDSGSKTTQDADPKGPSAGMNGSLDTKEKTATSSTAESKTEPAGPATEAETASTEALTGAPAEKKEEVVEKAPASPAEKPAKEKEAATSEAFTEPVAGKKDAKASKAKASEPVKDDFKPHYPEPKKPNFGIQALLWILMVVFGVTIIGVTIETLFINPSPFRLPATIVTIIWLLVTFPLWKKISLEAKVGLEVVALGFLTALAYTVYQGELVFPGVPAAILIPSLFTLMLLVILVSVWLIWPRFFWLPIVLSVIVLLGLVAPVWSLVCGGKDLIGILEMPSISFWPHLAGWIMAQIIFPFGIVLLLVLQAKNLFGSQRRKHAGFVLWALGLALIWTAPLAALDRSGETVFPKFGLIADQTFGITPVKTAAADAAAPEVTVPATPAPDEQAPVVKSEPAAPAAAATEPAPAEPAAPAPDTPEPAPATTPAEPAAAEVLAPAAPEDAAPATDDADVKPVVSEPADEATPAPAEEPAVQAAAVSTEEINELKERVTNLESEVANLKDKVGKQDRLIQDLFIWLADKFTQDIKARTRQELKSVSPEMKLMDEGPVDETLPADDTSKGPQPVDEPGQADKSGPSVAPAPSTDPKDAGSDQTGPAGEAPGAPTDKASTKEAT